VAGVEVLPLRGTRRRQDCWSREVSQDWTVHMVGAKDLPLGGMERGQDYWSREIWQGWTLLVA
jgi:hypothetical protein